MSPKPRTPRPGPAVAEGGACPVLRHRAARLGVPDSPAAAARCCWAPHPTQHPSQPALHRCRSWERTSRRSEVGWVLCSGAGARRQIIGGAQAGPGRVVPCAHAECRAKKACPGRWHRLAALLPSPRRPARPPPHPPGRLPASAVGFVWEALRSYGHGTKTTFGAISGGLWLAASAGHPGVCPAI